MGGGSGGWWSPDTPPPPSKATASWERQCSGFRVAFRTANESSSDSSWPLAATRWAMAGAVAVGTWVFSRDAVYSAARGLRSTGQSDGRKARLDEVVRAMAVVEDDERTGPYFVGRGSPLNSAGEVELDGAIMDGETLEAGSVAGLKGFACPVDVARHVLDDTPHTMLVGEGAREFAIRSGFVEEDLRTQWALEKYHKHNLKSLDEGNRPKDTLSLVCWSHPGYCMAGTGDGDIAMLFCPSFSVVRHMKEKRKPSDSCEAVLREIAARWRSLPSNRDMPMFELSLIAVSGDGSVGAATTISSWTDLEGNKYAGFPYVVCSQATSYETKTYVSASCLL